MHKAVTPVSYTHLDVYKRQTLGRFAPELLDDNYGAPQMMEVQMKEDSEENVADSILRCV